ncbi:MAG: hypothetical protein ACJZ6C_05915 [Candidatus Poriferisodalaceae bacterium]
MLWPSRLLLRWFRLLWSVGSDVVGAMVVTGIAEGADVLVVGTSAVVLDCCGWVVVSLAALSEASGAHATANTVNALHRTRQMRHLERGTVLEVIALG